MMNEMELYPDDKRVIDLLSKLKNSSGAYPSDILAARREVYLKQVANVGLGIGIGAGIKNFLKGSGNSTGTVATVTGKILETALIAAIAIEAGTIAYAYRDKIADLVRTYTGSANVQQVASPSADPSSPSSELIATTEVPSITVTTPSGTVIVTAGTSSPDVAGSNNTSIPSPAIAGDNSNNNGSNVGVNATPTPNGNNGNHYGQTPKPERTKDNNNNNDKNNDTNGGDNTDKDNKKDKDK
jgi:hypothetical protein